MGIYFSIHGLHEKVFLVFAYFNIFLIIKWQIFLMIAFRQTLYCEIVAIKYSRES